MFAAQPEYAVKALRAVQTVHHVRAVKTKQKVQAMQAVQAMNAVQALRAAQESHVKNRLVVLLSVLQKQFPYSRDMSSGRPMVAN